MTDPLAADGPLPGDGTDVYRDWDAAYVLGALSPAERRTFEDHLAGCERCSHAVAELVGLPGLLSGLPASEALAALESEQAAPGTPRAGAPAVGGAAAAADPPVPASLRHTLIKRVRRQRRLRTLVSGVVGAAMAAVLVLGIVFLPGLLNPPAAPNVSAALSAVQPSALSADVQLTSVRWGTKVEMACSYGRENYGGWGTSVRAYGLFATDSAGHVVRIATWNAGPGQVVHAGGSTDLRLAQIKVLDIRALDTGAVLLSLTVK